MTARTPDVPCPMRPGEHCRLCQVGATGPDDCPLVYLVMTDDELRAGVMASAVKEAGHRTAPELQPSRN